MCFVVFSLFFEFVLFVCFYFIQPHRLQRDQLEEGVCPVAALVASLHRIGWTVLDHSNLVADDGATFDLLSDPPCVVTQAARRAVRRWRLKGIAASFPSLVPEQPDLLINNDRSGDPPTGRFEILLDFPEAIDSLLSGRSGAGKKLFPDWEPRCKGDLRSAITGGQWPQVRLAAVQKWTDTSMCQLCHLFAGTLMHRHECPTTQPPDGWPSPPQQARMIKDRLSDDRRRLLTTRGLFVLKASLPAPPPGDTFTWLLPLPEDIDETCHTWFIDGSLFDESKRIMRRTGFGIALVDHRNSLVAAGHGQPPAWIYDAAGAELWALCYVLKMACDVPFVVTDCKGILDGLQKQPQALTQHDKALARTWSLIRHALDDDFVVMRTRIRWMASHTSISGISNAICSDGQPITATMWRANRLVDSLAKFAAGKNRLPEWAFKMLGAAAQLVKHSAAQLGVATHRANHHKVTQMVDGGTTVTKVCRDSTAERQQPRFFKARPPKPRVEASSSSSALQPLACSAAPAHRDSVNRGEKRPRAAETDSAAVGRRHSQAVKQKMQLRQDLQEQEQVARWVASRELVASSGPTARERLERLRQRLQDRQPQG